MSNINKNIISLLKCLMFLSVEFLSLIFLAGHWHWSSGHKCTSGRHLYTTDTISMDGFWFRYAKDRKPYLPCHRNGLLAARRHRPFRVATTQRLDRKYGHYSSGLYDSSPDRQHRSHIRRVQRSRQLFDSWYVYCTYIVHNI